MAIFFFQTMSRSVARAGGGWGNSKESGMHGLIRPTIFDGALDCRSREGKSGWVSLVAATKNTGGERQGRTGAVGIGERYGVGRGGHGRSEPRRS